MEASLYYTIFNILLLTAVLAGFAYLLVLSITMHDVQFITKSPFKFAFELLLVGCVPALPVFVFTLTRGMTMQKALIWFWSITVKFTIFHVLMQLSGYYTYTFGSI
jgi:hypothetical protein